MAQTSENPQLNHELPGHRTAGDRQTGPVASLSVIQGDLTRQNCDAIVNPSDTAVRGGGGVDGAVHAAGGPAILRDCINRFPEGLAPSDAGWSLAGNLPARWVIHTAGPNWAAGQRNPAALEACYRRALQVADELGATSVAFPLIGAGAHGWPRQVVIEIAIGTLMSTPTRVQDVRVVLLDEGAYRQTRAALLLRCPPPVARGSVGSLFDREPVQYSLRGDAYLWRELGARFAATPAPPDWFELRQLITQAAGDVLGQPLTDHESLGWDDAAAELYLAEFDPGHGMSAGAVCIPWWVHTGIPIILDRFEALYQAPKDDGDNASRFRSRSTDSR